MPQPSGHTTSRMRRLQTWTSSDVTSGILLLIAASSALVWANSPWRGAYQTLTTTEFGPASVHLHLSASQWAADGLLAIFFFVVGVELKHEVVAGTLRDLRLAAVPVIAAVGGMVVPAACYLAVTMIGDREALGGWAIPTATDIAFALAVLALFGRGLPRTLRTFLMTLAVVDDLLGILVIATCYTRSIHPLMLGAALVVVVVFGVLVRLPRPRWRPLIPVVLIPVGVAAWVFMHASGVHPTVAGVLLGFTVPALRRPGETTTRTHRFDAAVRPVSSALALPIFAFGSAGITVAGSGLDLVAPLPIGIIAGLVVGKVVGVLGSTALVTRLTPLALPRSIGIRDLLPVGMLTGTGFTVALLIAELFLGDQAGEQVGAAKAAILLGSLVSAVAAALLLRWDARTRH